MRSIPRPFGSYEFLRLFALSGNSEMWLARSRQRGGDASPVLIKRLLPHLADRPEAVELFLQEAKLGAQLRHPNIVRILEFGEAHGARYIAREYVEGESLLTVMRQARHMEVPISVDQSLSLIACVCEALAYAYHRVDPLDRPQRLLHREIAAQHILLGLDGAVKVIGFGGNNPADLPEPMRANLSGNSVEHLAPEQLLGQDQDQRTDIFCTGMVLYELLTGSRPFKRGSFLETMHAVYEGQLSPPSEVAWVPPELDALVMKALAKKKEDRYPDPRDFQSAIKAYLSAQGTEVGPAHIEKLMRTLFPNRQSGT